MDTAWKDPATFGEALQLHARRHDETIYHLYNAVVRPEDGVNRSTLISWGRGKRTPRAAISLEILGRIERRYRLRAGYFLSLSGTRIEHQAIFDFGRHLQSERRRLAWHLPRRFQPTIKPGKGRNPELGPHRDHKRQRTIAGIRSKAPFASAMRFASAVPRGRSASLHRTDAGRKSGIVIAPKRLNDEMAEFLRFKIADIRCLRHAEERGLGNGDSFPEGGAFRAVVRGVRGPTRERSTGSRRRSKNF